MNKILLMVLLALPTVSIAAEPDGREAVCAAAVGVFKAVRTSRENGVAYDRHAELFLGEALEAVQSDPNGGPIMLSLWLSMDALHWAYSLPKSMPMGRAVAAYDFKCKEVLNGSSS